jgi:hypothetical protein
VTAPSWCIADDILLEDLTKPEWRPLLPPSRRCWWSREELVYLLGEACEIEHGLMCEYLNTQFSLKRTVGEDLTRSPLITVPRARPTAGFSLGDGPMLKAQAWSRLGNGPSFGGTVRRPERTGRAGSFR